MTAEDDIRAEFANLENLERRQAALRGLAAQLTPLCDCPPLGMTGCPHCGRFYGQSHRDRCHKAAVGNLNVAPEGSGKPEPESE